MQDESSCDAACRQAVPWAEEFRAPLDRHLRVATRRVAADGRRYAWWEFARYYREHADAMWEAAWGREMAIWSRVVARLEEHFRRIRWRIIARKMNRFAGVCLIYAYRRINPRRVAPLFEHDWPADRTPPPLPRDDYEDEPWDVTDKQDIEERASSRASRRQKQRTVGASSHAR